MNHRWILMGLGVSLLVGSIGLGVHTNNSVTQEKSDQRLLGRANAEAARLEDHFERARLVALVASRDPADRNFESGSAPASEQVNTALGLLSEALPQGSVYQSAPYLSPDTGGWVISNSTPVAGANGGRGLLRFEMSLDSFQSPDGEAGDVVVVDATTGRVVFDPDASASEQLVAPGQAGEPGDSRWGVLRGRSGSDVLSIDASRVAYSAVTASADNANRWLVVASTPLAGSGFLAGVGPAAIVVLLAALMLLVASVSSSRSYHRRLTRAALTDPLTGLPNRALLYHRIHHGLMAARRSSSQAALVMIDLDRFKEVNDTLGHDQGDELLIAVAERISALIRPGDTLARLGGDEFVIFLREAHDPVAGEEIAARLIDRMLEPFVLRDMVVQVGASVGISYFPEHGNDAEGLLRRAEIAMYQAKERHAGYQVYRSERDGHTQRRLTLASELNEAIKNDGLVVHYQPKIDLATGELRGVEALVRWNHRTLGLVPPDEFVSIAEDTGLIRPLTMSVLAQSMRQCRTWSALGFDQHIAVNLSARTLLDRSLVGEVEQMLAKWHVSGSSFTFEITETGIVADEELAAITISGLHELGILISIDDFGTGYFSLAGLRRMPIDEIKIDRSFVSTMSAEEKDAFIVRSTIALGQDLGFHVVAEGVEDEETLRELRSLGCDSAQGFLMSRPLPPEDLVPWLVNWKASRSTLWSSAGVRSVR